jgi:uncharacterized protein YraI
MTRNVFAAAAVAGILAWPGAALAQTAVVSTDLNVRLGPGPTYEVMTVVPVNETVTIHGCLEALTWCEVSFGTHTGWVYADYLVYEVAGSPLVIREAATQVEVPVVTYDPQATGTASGAVSGAIAGAIIGGPVGAAVGGVAGATIGAAVTAPAHVRTYVAEQPVEPVYAEGEVVIGATLPEAVVLHPVPDYEYRFAYVNHQRVLVDPASRQVVYIVR